MIQVLYWLICCYNTTFFQSLVMFFMTHKIMKAASVYFFCELLFFATWSVASSEIIMKWLRLSPSNHVHEFHETRHSVTSYFMEKRLQTMLWHPNAKVNSHQRWKQTRFRVCFHLWCELTSTMNVTEWQVPWNPCLGEAVCEIGQCIHLTTRCLQSDYRLVSSSRPAMIPILRLMT